jgi:hypothetical protein
VTDNLRPEEFEDIDLVLKMGAEKYGAHTFLKEKDHHLTPKDNCSSMFRHLAKHTAGIRFDEESGLDHLLHLATRALMGFTRHKRGLDFYSVPGLEDLSVNSKGQVKRKGKVVDNVPGAHGYKQVSVKGKKHYVHRMVAATYLGPCPEGYYVNHKDGDKLNNDIHNLEYVTPGGNLQHAYDTGLYKAYDRNGENHPGNKLTEEDVKEILTLFEENDLTYTEVASMYGVKRHAISRIIRGLSWTHIQETK